MLTMSNVPKEKLSYSTNPPTQAWWMNSCWFVRLIKSHFTMFTFFMILIHRRNCFMLMTMLTKYVSKFMLSFWTNGMWLVGTLSSYSRFSDWHWQTSNVQWKWVTKPIFWLCEKSQRPSFKHVLKPTSSLSCIEENNVLYIACCIRSPERRSLSIGSISQVSSQKTIGTLLKFMQIGHVTCHRKSKSS